MSFSLPAKHWSAALAWALFVLTIALSLFCLYSGFSPILAFIGLTGFFVFAYVLFRAPQVFLVAVIFAPQWKAYWPLSSLDRVVDLTLVMLGCLVACLLCRALAQISRLDDLAVGELFYGQGKVMLGFALFAAAVSISYLYTTAPEYGGSKLFRFLGIGTVLLISPLFLVRAEVEFRRFLRWFVLFGAVTVVQLLAGLETTTQGEDVTRIGAGWLVGMATIIVLFYPLFESSAWQKVFVICALPFLVVGLIASVARGPMVALALILLIRVGLWCKEGHQSMAIALGAVCIVSGLGAFFVIRHAGGNKYTHKAMELVDMVEGDATRGSATARLSFYKAAFPEIPRHPLLGHGIGSWSVFYWGRDEREYPHNLLVEVAFEQGFLGVAMLLFLLARAYKANLWLWREENSRYLVIGILIVYCLMVAMFSGDLDDNRVLWVWIGMTMALCRNLRLQSVEAFRTQLATVSGSSFSRPSILHS